MSTLALAYSSEDNSTARRITTELAGAFSPRHFAIGRANDGPTLADELADFTGHLVLLVTDHFLTNPNCLLRLEAVFTGNRREVLPVIAPAHRYDEASEEIITVDTSLGNQADLMHYVNHWQDRYIALRQDAPELREQGGSSFDAYLRKIRTVSVSVEDTLTLLRDAWRLSLPQFAANGYQQLYIFTDRGDDWPGGKEAGEESLESRSLESGGESQESREGSQESREGSLESREGSLESREEAFDYDALLDRIDREEPDPVLPTPDPSTLDSTTPDPSTPDSSTPDPSTPDPSTLDPATPDSTTPDSSTPDSSTPDSSLSTLDSATLDSPLPTPDPAEQAADWIERAWALSDDGDAASAAQLLADGSAALPEREELRYHRALLLALGAGDYAAAREAVNDLLHRNPAHADGLYLSGDIHLSQGRFDDARHDWERLAALVPDYPELDGRLGLLLARDLPDAGAEALHHLERAAEREPTPGVLMAQAELLADTFGRRGKATKVLRRLTELNPDYAPAHYRLATLLLADDQPAAARNAYRTAVALHPAYGTAVNNRAFLGGEAPPGTAPAAPPPARSSDSDVLAALRANIGELEQRLLDQERAAAAPPPRPGHDRVVLISGATSGIGRATARRLAADGYRLLLLGRRSDRLEALREELRRAHGTESWLLELDVRERAAVAETLGELPPRWAAIDVLINNAGKAKGFDPIHAGSLDHWDEMIDVNLRGLLYLTRAVSPGMVERGRGTIINVASTAGKEVYPNGNVYCATKHAVDALTHAMRLDLVHHGIRVGQICPAHVEETEFARVRFDGDRERARIYDDFQPLRAPDVAEAIHFMISQPPHVNVLDMVLQGTQQASSTVVDRSGRHFDYLAAEEE